LYSYREENMNKTLYILIGPKGSGKTYIGNRIEALTGIKFLSVEPLWLNLAEGEDGWGKVEETVAGLFLQHDKVIIESLGAGEGFNRMYASLKNKYTVKLIKVETDAEECFQRAMKRDGKNHIPLSEEKVREYNRIAARVQHTWDAVFDNNGPATDEEIRTMITSL